MKHTFSKIACIVLGVVLTVSLLNIVADAATDPAAIQAPAVSDSPKESKASETVSESSREESQASSSEVFSEPESSSSKVSSNSLVSSSKSKSSRYPSSDCLLRSLRVSYHPLLPSFDPDVRTYGVLVSYDVTRLYIYATPDNSDASVRITGSYRYLAVGINTIRVTVTAPDGSTRVYTIKAKRQDQNGGNIDSAALLAYLNGLESNPSTSGGASGAASSSSPAGNSPMPTGMRILIAVAVVSGLLVTGTIWALAQRSRKLKKQRRKRMQQGSQNLYRSNR